ncbi:MAG: hypothetical protein H6741_10180 [Alphaproteobacteria bacterium]|nr:hypothetical protein [Alphaproteobacteria bacterium]
MLALLLLPLALATPLAEPGEDIEGCRVEAVEAHPEYIRVALRLPDARTLSVEATRAAGGGACTHHGLTLFPRWELLGEQVEAEDQPPVVRRLCERLEAHGQDLDLSPPRSSEDAPASAPGGDPSWTTPGPYTPPTYTWLHGALLALLGSALLTALGPGRRGWAALAREERRDLLAVAGISLATRLLLSPRMLLWAPFFGYGRLTEAWGIDPRHPLYGGGFGALMGPLSRLAGYSPDVVFGTNLLLGALAPPLLWMLARLLLPGRLPALVAGLGLALLPMHVKLSATEIMHVSLTSFELLSMLGVAAFLRSAQLGPALMSALAIGYATHIRPEALPAVAAPVVWVLARAERRHAPGIALAAAVIGGMVGLRLLDMLAGPSQTAVSFDRLAAPAFWLQVLLPSIGSPGASANTHSFLQLRLTPFTLPLLAALALGSPRRRLLLGLLGWWALTALPVLPKSWPLADALRLQLPALLPSLLLAALGAEALRQRWPRVSRNAVLVGVVAPSLLLLGFALRPTAPQAEHAPLRAWIPRLPEGTTVLYDDGGPHHADLGRWASAMNPALRWRGMSTLDAQQGQHLMAYIGTSCFFSRPERGKDDFGPLPTACPAFLARCTLRPWETTTLSTRTDVDVQLEATPTVGFYFVDGCGGAE